MGVTQGLFSALNTCLGPVRSKLPERGKRGSGRQRDTQREREIIAFTKVYIGESTEEKTEAV